MSVNPVRTCPICTGTDDHPRHVLVLADGVTTVPYHMDCHAMAGCAVCEHQLAGVGGVAGNPKGGPLRKHLLSLPPVEVEHAENGDGSDPHNLTTAVVTSLEG